jgi:hypothetical protein
MDVDGWDGRLQGTARRIKDSGFAGFMALHISCPWDKQRTEESIWAVKQGRTASMAWVPAPACSLTCACACVWTSMFASLGRLSRVQAEEKPSAARTGSMAARVQGSTFDRSETDQCTGARHAKVRLWPREL